MNRIQAAVLAIAPKIALGLALCGSEVQAQSFELDVLETEDMKLIYSDPLQTYLVPHVVRSFHNSMAFQKYIFDWTPWEKSSVLLTDFTDYGNARAGSVPFNFVQIDIAPLSRTFDTKRP